MTKDPLTNATAATPLSRRAILEFFAWPLLAGLAVSAAIRLTDLDLRLASGFWQAGGQSWPGRETAWAMALYDYGTWPAVALAMGSLLFVVISFIRKLPGRRVALFLVLSMIAGPGLVVNAIFKDYYGRPRPAQVTEFGGDLTMLQVGTPGTPGAGKSFPSGHASMGFFLGVPAWILLRRRPRAAFACATLGIGAGALIGYVRMLQGGHWLSDVLWSGLFVYLTSLTLALALRLIPTKSPS